MSTAYDSAIARLFNQFNPPEKTRVKYLLESIINRIDDSTDITNDLLNERNINDALGIWLDNIGEIVGIPRPSNQLDDSEIFTYTDDEDLFDREYNVSQPDADLLAQYKMFGLNYGPVVNEAFLNYLVDGNMEKQNGTDVIVDGDMEVTGPDVIVDGDMEATGVGSWTSYNSATLTKDVTDPHSGSQCLRVAYNGTLYPAAVQSILTIGRTYRIKGWARSDTTRRPLVYDTANPVWTSGSLSGNWESFDVVFVATSTDLRFTVGGAIAAAGYCEFDDIQVIDETVACAAWTVGRSALLSKQEDPHSGSQCLRIAYNGIADEYAIQTICTVGRTYRIKGYARGGGATPRLYMNVIGNIWVGTGSGSWQAFDIIFVAGATQILFQQIGGAAGTYIEFDDVTVIDLTDSCDEWTAGNSAILSKRPDPYSGNQCLRVAYGGTNNPYAKQIILTNGKIYHVKGYARGDGLFEPRIRDSATQLWAGTSSTTFQEFDFTFTAQGTDFRLYAYATVDGYAEFDQITVNELDEDGNEILNSYLDLTNNDCVNECSPHGRNFVFDSSNSAYLTTDRQAIIRTNQHTIAYLLKTDDVLTEQFLWCNNTATEPIKTKIESGKLFYSIYDGSTHHEVESDITADTWTLIICTCHFDGIDTYIKIYKDGVLQDSDSFEGKHPLLTIESALIGCDSSGSNFYDGKLSNGYWVFSAEKDQTWITAFNAAIQAAINTESDALAYSSLSELDGGHYTGIDGIPIDGSVIDSIYRTYCYAKVYSTYSKPTYQGIYQFIKNTFDKEAKVYSVATGEITVELQESFTGLERLILKKYAPVSAGMTLEIINWP